MQLVLVGINYKSANLSLRESLSFNSSHVQTILSELKPLPEIQEVVMLSTCNRTEVFAITADPQATRKRILQLLCDYSGFTPESLDPLLYTFYNKFAASHLFEVASGLDSMVLGENEILRQVKQALENAQQTQTAGPVLNQLLRFALTAGKRVRTETRINEGSTSLASLAARLVQDHCLKPRVLLLGAGQIARVLLQHLEALNAEILLANRTPAHARQLAEQYAGQIQTLSLAEVPAALGKVDAVISCTASDHYLVRLDDLICLQNPLLMVDLSVPRNLDPAISQLPTVQLYDVDDLQVEVEMSLEQRRSYIAQAQSIIAEEATHFLEWFHQREMVPTIQGLYQTFETIRQQEISRGTQKYREQMGPEAELVLERVTKAITQKILHHPMIRLKNAPPEKQQQYQRALNELFGLDAQDEMDKYLHLPAQAHKAHHPPS